MTSSATAISEFITQPALALVGMSRSGKGFGNIAGRELRTKGYRVYPIHLSAHEVGGEKCYARFADLPEPVSAALIVVPPPQAVEVVRDAAAAGVRHLWLQQGAESPAALTLCHELGLTVVAGECILMFTRPTGIHKAHRWIRGVFGGLPQAGALPEPSSVAS